MDDTIAAFMVALGFKVDSASQNTAKKAIADYEAAVRAAEKRIEDARWAGAKSEQEIAKLTRETNLKEAKDALAAAQQREKAEAEQLKKREQHAKEFVSAWNRMALAATAAATAISYAVTTVTRSFDNLGFVSQRTGASVQALNSLGYAFKQVGGSTDQAVGAVESFAKALRENSGVKSFVKSLGVDTTKDTAQQLLDTVEKLNKHPYDVAFREAGLAGISEENYNLISRQLAQIKAYRGEYDDMTKSLGVNSKDATDASMAFQRSLNRLQATASALTDKLLVSLAPALKDIVDRFQEWIRSNPEKVERVIESISKAAVWLAEKIGALITAITGSDGDAFIKRWDAFAERVERVAHNVERIVSGLVRLVGFVERLSGTRTILGDGQRTSDILNRMRAEQDGGAIGYPTPGTVRDDRSWWQRHAPRALGGRDAPAPSGGTPSGSSAGNLTALIDAEAARAGIDPRIMHGIRAGESGKRQNGNDPAAAYDKKDDALESSWGPFQLNRRRGLGVQFEKETGLDVRDPRTIPDQVRWVAEGLKKNGRAWLRNWMGYHGDRDADPRWGDSGYVPSPQPAGSSQVAGGAHPLAGVGRVSSDYGMRTHPILGGRRMHAGIDLAAPAGTSVQSMTAGLVSISPSGDVTIKQGDGSSTTYRHVVANVADGARVAAGQVIAQLRARDPRSTGPHLHFEARDKDGNLMDPKSLLAPIPASQRAQAAAKADFSRSQIAPRMDPGGFDVNALTRPDPLASPAVQNSTTTNRAVHQTINNTTTITGADRPREAARIMESAFGNMHGLALRNAQSAVA